jgi:hypothetical protein
VCFFVDLKFQLFPERTRVRYPYEDPGPTNETQEEEYERAKALRRKRNAINRLLNKRGDSPSFQSIIEACRDHEREMQAQDDHKRFKKKSKKRSEEEKRERKVADAEQEAEEEQEAAQQEAA